MIFNLGMEADQVWRFFKLKGTRFLGYGDAARVQGGSVITPQHVFRALETAKKKGWYSPSSFNVEEYKRLCKVEEGDMNWVLPGSIIAFSSPSICPAEGLDPRYYIQYFQSKRVTAIIRLNERLYEDKYFIANGIRVYPMEIPDCTAPQENRILEFIKILENEIELRKGVVAVHCRAGLGRTGTMIAAYLMFKHNIDAGEAIAWTRLCRPGCVMGPQQAFLE
jgi:cell division cycle 14